MEIAVRFDIDDTDTMGSTPRPGDGCNGADPLFDDFVYISIEEDSLKFSFDTDSVVLDDNTSKIRRLSEEFPSCDIPNGGLFKQTSLNESGGESPGMQIPQRDAINDALHCAVYNGESTELAEQVRTLFIDVIQLCNMHAFSPGIHIYLNASEFESHVSLAH